MGSSGADCSVVDGRCSACIHGACDTGDCKCDAGFEGAGCDIYNAKLDPCGKSKNFCSGRGICSVDDSGSPTCTCTSGFTGLQCQKVDTNKTKCENGCSGNGKCSPLTDQCECAEGWKGADCGTSQCPEFNGTICSGHGMCSNNGKCICDPCFSGDQCEDNSLTRCPSLCSGHGKCVCARHNNGTFNATCECGSGWSGPSCAVMSADADTGSTDWCPNGCSGNGDCGADGRCVCYAGWEGASCNMEASAYDTATSTAEENALDDLDALLQTDEGRVSDGPSIAPMAALWD